MHSMYLLRLLHGPDCFTVSTLHALCLAFIIWCHTSRQHRVFRRLTSLLFLSLLVLPSCQINSRVAKCLGRHIPHVMALSMTLMWRHCNEAVSNYLAKYLITVQARWAVILHFCDFRNHSMWSSNGRIHPRNCGTDELPQRHPAADVWNRPARTMGQFQIQNCYGRLTSQNPTILPSNL